MKQTPRRILFVCLGNICRSPAAEGVMKKLVADAQLGDSIFVDSAGTSDYHRGEPADARMRAAANKRGYNLTSRSRQLVAQDLRTFDLIVAMDRENERQIHRLASKSPNNVVLLSKYLDDSWPTDVPDPYHGVDDGFEYVLDMLEAACPAILNQLIPASSNQD